MSTRVLTIRNWRDNSLARIECKTPRYDPEVETFVADYIDDYGAGHAVWAPETKEWTDGEIGP